MPCAALAHIKQVFKKQGSLLPPVPSTKNNINAHYKLSVELDLEALDPKAGTSSD